MTRPLWQHWLGFLSGGLNAKRSVLESGVRINDLLRHLGKVARQVRLARTYLRAKLVLEGIELIRRHRRTSIFERSLSGLERRKKRLLEPAAKVRREQGVDNLIDSGDGIGRERHHVEINGKIRVLGGDNIDSAIAIDVAERDTTRVAREGDA